MPTKEHAQIIKQLKDIKDVVIIDDNSFMMLLSIIIIIIFFILIGFIIYKLKTKITKTKQLSSKEQALKRLKELNFEIDDYQMTKDIVYTFTIDASEFLDTQVKIDQYKKILKQLEKYKYKKDIKVLDNNLKKEIKDFIKELK